MIYDSLIYFIIMLILPLIASIYVKVVFNKYNKVVTSRRIRTEEVVRKILDSNGLTNTKLGFISGNLSDCYDPRKNEIMLSNSTMGQMTIAAIGVAAHECGHACQYAENYTPVIIRSKVVGVTNICSRLWYLVFLIGLALSNMTIGTNLIYASVAMFAMVVLFQVVTLPAEIDASKRAMATLEKEGILEPEELPKAKKVLRAAALTYVAGLVTSIMQLLRLMTLSRRR